MATPDGFRPSKVRFQQISPGTTMMRRPATLPYEPAANTSSAMSWAGTRVPSEPPPALHATRLRRGPDGHGRPPTPPAVGRPSGAAVLRKTTGHAGLRRAEVEHEGWEMPTPTRRSGLTMSGVAGSFSFFGVPISRSGSSRNSWSLRSMSRVSSRGSWFQVGFLPVASRCSGWATSAVHGARGKARFAVVLGRPACNARSVDFPSARR